jgi:hypothetical protein
MWLSFSSGVAITGPGESLRRSLAGAGHPARRPSRSGPGRDGSRGRRVVNVGHGRTEQELQLAELVAARAEPVDIVPLDQQWQCAERRGQPGCVL